MRVFKSKAFDRFARKETIPDEDLLDAVNRAERGNIAADLGGGVIKQRIARRGGGKSGGYRTIIVIRFHSIAFFVYGFAKKDIGDISPAKLVILRKLALDLLNCDDKTLDEMVKLRTLIEVKHGG